MINLANWGMGMGSGASDEHYGRSHCRQRSDCFSVSANQRTPGYHQWSLGGLGANDLATNLIANNGIATNGTATNWLAPIHVPSGDGIAVLSLKLPSDERYDH